MMKVAYGYGLRFNELRRLQTVDFARNPHAREFGSFGVCKVRYGKSRRSSPHKGRGVLTVWRWTPGILEIADHARDSHVTYSLAQPALHAIPSPG